MKKKEISKILEILKIHLKQGTDISFKEVEKYGYDTKQNKIEINNIILSKNLLSDKYTINCKNNLLNVDGKSITEYKELVYRLQSLYLSNEKKINKSEFYNFNFYWLPFTIKFENIRLDSYPSFYSISILDKNKNINNQWVDSVIDAKKIIDCIINYKYTKSKLKLTEVQLNKELEIFFKEYFENVRKGDTTNKGLIDLNFGNGKFAIELKLAESLLKTGESQRARTQIRDYIKQYGKNIIILIAGEKKHETDKRIQEVISEMKEIGCKYYYLAAL